MKKGNREPGKLKNPTCASINLILCGEVLRKVLGKIGSDKLQFGDATSKKRAVYELIASNSFDPSDADVQMGKSVVGNRSR